MSVSGLNAGYGRKLGGGVAVQILHDIDVAVPRGSTVGVIGESGCGKSTLARVMSGLLPPATGEVRLAGEPLAGDVKARSREQLRRVQIVMQMPDVSFNPLKTIGHALERPLEFYFDMPADQRHCQRSLPIVDRRRFPAARNSASTWPVHLLQNRKLFCAMKSHRRWIPSWVHKLSSCSLGCRMKPLRALCLSHTICRPLRVLPTVSSCCTPVVWLSRA